MAKAGAVRGDRSPATRAALVEAAVGALRDVGFAGASAREIAGRAGCHQSQVFYHFGSVTSLLLAALDAVSERRMQAYRQALDEAGTLTELIDAAQRVFAEDLDAGYVAVLVQLITAAQTVPGLAAEVAERLAPWQAFAEEALDRAEQWSPVGPLVPPAEAGLAVVAGLLGLELLTSLSGDRQPALALFDRARFAAGLMALSQAFLPGFGAPDDEAGGQHQTAAESEEDP